MMLKIKIEHNHPNSLSLINDVNKKSIKSSEYYKGYNTWYTDKFIPSYLKNESKISNLSPLIDGVGITQALLDSCEFIISNDYDIYIPDQAKNLIEKVKKLGFHHIDTNFSNDNTKQHKFSKPKNISWI